MRVAAGRGQGRILILRASLGVTAKEQVKSARKGPRYPLPTWCPEKVLLEEPTTLQVWLAALVTEQVECTRKGPRYPLWIPCFRLMCFMLMTAVISKATSLLAAVRAAVVREQVKCTRKGPRHPLLNLGVLVVFSVLQQVMASPVTSCLLVVLLAGTGP